MMQIRIPVLEPLLLGSVLYVYNSESLSKQFSFSPDYQGHFAEIGWRHAGWEVKFLFVWFDSEKN